MSRSFLAAIRSAVASAPEPIAHVDDDAGAFAPDATAPRGHEQENVMSDDPRPAAASGISQTAFDAAVAAARQEGEAAGARAANERLSTVIAAEGIAGNAGRVTAAVDLAIKSPGMSATDVAAFVAANVAADIKAVPAPSASLANRLAVTAGDPLAGADQPDAARVQAGWDRAAAQANARFGKDAA